ncbi:MAG: rod shape-determining protein [Candidatus Eremiobacterota bacterium]
MLNLLGLDQFVDRLAPEVGIDLGTANTPVLTRSRGICWNEPSYLALDRRERRVIAVGSRARRMQGRAPSHVQVVRPIQNGVIADYEMAQVLLSHALGQVRQGMLRPRVLVGIPADATDVECQALADAVRDAGARSVFLLPQPLLAALGAGLPVLDPRASMVVDVGGGSSQAAVLSSGAIVASGCIRTAGHRMDLAVASYLRHRHNLIVGDCSAEDLKIEAGAALEEDTVRTATVRGRDLHSGLPRSILVDSNELARVLAPVTAEIAALVKSTLESTPPELVGQVKESGMALCGGGSLLRGMDGLIGQVTGVACRRVERPLECLALGAQKLFSDPRTMRVVLGGHERAQA